MPVFLVKKGVNQDKKFSLNALRIIIGRSPDNELVLPDETVDLAHTSIESRGRWWILQDLGSLHGTRVNDLRIKGPYALQDGDLIELNEQVALEFQVVDTDSYLQEPILEDEIESYFELSQAAEAEPVSKGGYLLVSIILFAVIIGSLTFWGIRQNWFGPQPPIGPDLPPLLETITPETQITVRPGQTVLFHTEAQDQRGIKEVEFWVNNVHADSQEPPNTYTTKMQTMFSWSTTEPGTYELMVIAFDDTDQRSNAATLQVTVK